MKFQKTISVEELISIDYRYQYTDEELMKDWKKLCSTKIYKSGAQFKPGMKLCQHFCDNFWHIENDKGMSFHKAWNDPKVMATVKDWGTKGMSNLWLSWIRRAVFMCSGLANSSFYRPHFSRQIIQKTEKKHGVLFDPCFGWGGRMLGTVSSNWNYIGCDPNPITFQNVQSILQFIKDNHNSLVDLPKVNLYNIPAETYDFKNSEKVDIVLTSPPYFNLEVYSKDKTQSYNNYTDYASWRDGWLFPLIENCFSIIKDDGMSVWNVMNFKGNDVVGDIIKFHENKGWKLDDTVGFDSPLKNIRNLKNKDITYIFIRD